MREEMLEGRGEGEDDGGGRRDCGDIFLES